MKTQKADRAYKKLGAYHEQIEDFIYELQQHADSLKDITEDSVNWGHVAEAAHLAGLLQEAADFAYNREE